MTGERHAADEPHGLSREGWPLLVRYDLDAVRSYLTKEILASRSADLCRLEKTLGAGSVLVKDEGRLPTGSFKARGVALAVSMAKSAAAAHHRPGRRRSRANRHKKGFVRSSFAVPAASAFVTGPTPGQRHSVMPLGTSLPGRTRRPQQRRIEP